MTPRRPLTLLFLSALLLLAAAPAASAARVVVLSTGGDARVVADPLAGTGLDVPEARRPAPAPRARLARRGPSVRGELRRMLRRGEIDAVQHDARRATYEEARSFARRLSGRRRIEMAGVVALVDSLAARRQLTASRLAPLWLTLERNRQWWSEGPLLASGQRIQFSGSQLLWQYVPGYGVQLHPLANFGRLNGFWQGGRRYRARMAILMDELLAIRAERGGAVAWEYYFPFGPSSPPWVSGMAQATALQSLARAAVGLGRQADVLPIAASGLGVFEQAPPTGVRVRSGRGTHYLLYSGDPGLRVLNGFMQALSGLQSFAHTAGDARARALYDEGRRAAAREIRASDTGAWSLYSLGRVSQESTLAYHQLVTGFLSTLCKSTSDQLYCDTHARFARYLTEPPALRVTTRSLRAGRTGLLRFRLSKKSAVSVQVSQSSRVALGRSLGTLPYGGRYFAFAPSRRRPGDYTVTLTAIDLAGNRASVSAPLKVLPARRKRR